MFATSKPPLLRAHSSTCGSRSQGLLQLQTHCSLCCDAGLLNELVSFDTATGAVRSLSPLPYGAGDVELVALPNNRLLAIGGLVEAAAGDVQVGWTADHMHALLGCYYLLSPCSAARLPAPCWPGY